MSFETLPRESIDALYDPGIFYTYHGGQLRDANGRKVLFRPEAPVSNFTSTELTYYPVEVTLNDASCHFPPSLLSICTSFVAENVQLVQSFYGFPELIAKTIFDRIISKKDSFETDVDISWLKKFTDEYGSAVCKSFVIRQSCLSVELCVDVISQCFSKLVVLDVDSCRLGDDHVLLQVIADLKW